VDEPWTFVGPQQKRVRQSRCPFDRWP